MTKIIYVIMWLIHEKYKSDNAQKQRCHKTVYGQWCDCLI